LHTLLFNLARSLFFLIESSPSHLSTLSLHDALPISRLTARTASQGLGEINNDPDSRRDGPHRPRGPFSLGKKAVHEELAWSQCRVSTRGLETATTAQVGSGHHNTGVADYFVPLASRIAGGGVAHQF